MSKIDAGPKYDMDDMGMDPYKKYPDLNVDKFITEKVDENVEYLYLQYRRVYMSGMGTGYTQEGNDFYFQNLIQDAIKKAFLRQGIEYFGD